MHIDDLIAASKKYINRQGQENSELIIGKDWGQGRTAYGGISAALIYVAIKEKVTEDRLLRSFSCNFIGPLVCGEAFDIEVEVLRQGKNATQVMAKAMQNGNVCALVQACFGVPRQSKIRVENNDRHEMPLPKNAQLVPRTPKMTPEFLQHFDIAMQDGGLPFTGSNKSHLHGWMRFSEAPQQLKDIHLIALIDAWPATTLQMLSSPAPASSMSWNLEFIHPQQVLEAGDWLAYQSHTRQSAQRYGHTEANIWNAQGELLAISRQTVAVFD